MVRKTEPVRKMGPGRKPERKTELCKQMGRKLEELRKKVSGRNKVS